jgi:opacity protein-like surface antigen
MLRSMIIATALVAASSVHAAPAAAQFGSGGPGIRLGVGGGVTVPTSGAAEALRTGINGQAFVLVNTGMVPPLRFNVGYQRFEMERSALPTGTGETSILSGVAGVNLGLLQIGPIRPYVTAGLGGFNIRNDVDGVSDRPDSQTRFGVDGGAGLILRLGRLEAFVEGRVQNVYTDAGLIDTSTIRYVPVSFGILF